MSPRSPASRLGAAGWLAPLLVGFVAFGARLSPALRGDGLTGLQGYDDGVYFSAATAFVAGRMPYSDFLLLHPPGIVLALTPAALLGTVTGSPVAFAVARVLWMLVGTLNAVAVHRLTRRFGPGPALLAGTFYALWPRAVRSETTTRLEPLVTLLLLAGWLLVASRRTPHSVRLQVLAGAALGLAPVVKIWAVVPSAVLVVWFGLLPSSALRGRPVRRVVAGAAGAAIVVCLPFALAAPTAMLRMVLLDQFGRPDVGPERLGRLTHLLAVQAVRPGSGPTAEVLLTAFGTAVLVPAAVAAWRRRDERTAARAAVVVLAGQLVVLAMSPAYLPYYAAFPAAALAVVLGASFTVRRARALAYLCAGAAIAVLGWAAVRSPLGIPFPADRLRPVVAARGCVTSDLPATLLLLDVLRRDAAAGCPLLVDPSGLTYDVAALPPQPDGRAVPRPLNPVWQRELMAYLAAGDAMLLAREPRETGLSRPSLRVVQSWPVLGSAGGYTVRTPG